MAQSHQPGGDGSAEFVRRIVTDPKNVPDVMRLYGYPGASSEENHDRLYLSPDLSTYVEVPRDAILHRMAIPPEQDPNGAVVLWVRRDAALQQRMTPAAQGLAQYFAGPIAGAAAAGAPMPLPPLTILPAACPITIAPAACPLTAPVHCTPACTHLAPCTVHCTHVAPCTANCTHVAPCTANCTHVAPCTANCTHVAPCTANCTHVAPCTANCTHVAPCTANCTHVAPCTANCTHVAPCTANCTHVAPCTPACLTHIPVQCTHVVLCQNTRVGPACPYPTEICTHVAPCTHAACRVQP